MDIIQGASYRTVHYFLNYVSLVFLRVKFFSLPQGTNNVAMCLEQRYLSIKKTDFGFLISFGL